MPITFSSPPYDTYDYVDVPTSEGEGSGISSGGIWRVMSSGPDLVFAAGGFTADPSDTDDRGLGVDYDPTNGSLSAGDVVRVSAEQAPTTSGGLTRRPHQSRAARGAARPILSGAILMRSHCAFTLIELLVVVAIIAIPRRHRDPQFPGGADAGESQSRQGRPANGSRGARSLSHGLGRVSALPRRRSRTRSRPRI